MARIYLASSWRNPFHSAFLKVLRRENHEVYDFRDKFPMDGGGPNPTSFQWSELDEKWQDWNPIDYRDRIIMHERAASGYVGDLRGMEWADTCVMLIPCGNSAHIEAGYMKGRGKRLIIAFPNNDTFWEGELGKAGSSSEGKPEKVWKFEPDLMYLLADNITIGIGETVSALRSPEDR